MKKRKVGISIISTFILIIASFIPWSLESQASQNNVEYWGIYIAIADYNGSKGDLPTQEEYLKTVYKELIKYENWKEENIRLLIDEDATYENIVQAFNWVANVSDENDVVFFYYFGHGGEIPDENGDEEDGYDEVITTWELKIDKCISDDLLAKKFDNIKADGIAIVLDCCLSGELIEKKTIGKPIKLNFYKELSEDISTEGRVILTSAYGDGITFATPIGSVCSYYLATALNKSFILYSIDKILTAEEVFRFAKFVTYYFFLELPFLMGITYGLVGIIMATLGGIILKDFNFIDIIEGFIGGFVFGFWMTIIFYIIQEIDAYYSTGHWAIPFPQLYDGYDGKLRLANRDR